ncbi:MAG: NUDIX domain-containing protein [Planctomycetota bacterium]|nr:NUDIX domain-containing protein [Planctomycetota bacterium]
MALIEKSAGIVLFHDLSNSTFIKPQREFLLLSTGRYWDFPKGHIDRGETDLQAAIRELREETGITDPKLIAGFAHEIFYFFRSKKVLVRKSVIFFLASTTQQEIKISKEHVAFEFFSFERALTALSFANGRAILRLAEQHLVQTPS